MNIIGRQVLEGSEDIYFGPNFLPLFVGLIGILIFIAPFNALYGIRNRYTKDNPQVWRIVIRIFGGLLIISQILIYLFWAHKRIQNPKEIILSYLLTVILFFVIFIAAHLFSHTYIKKIKLTSTNSIKC